MKEITLQLNGLEMLEFKPTTGIAKIKVSYSINGEKIIETGNFDLTRKCESLATSIINYVKSKGEQEVDEDNLLDTLFIKKFVNLEKVEEKLFSYFSKLCENYRFMRLGKSQKDYMKLYDAIKISRIMF
ncbi:hypothetical protein HN992_03035 [Candidatus Woesearchaeota archaeon]|jgi:hypothetical protein|nr:hypothetical protein [Candidatus Woesearchaeota archaeon]MBT3438762.1 hypothetical protein [Candidatus Woesearchaeota archaeon]MBT4058459.1 hypothetical protein [Candidatus Woesearchaeota archaeon]MBT4208752.1 hypothetical protein [Candidatus Woesearchaeota archaeon]MBT4733159.1 hypothetical protein [Candidatus Woesearchaeota archaeon]